MPITFANVPLLLEDPGHEFQDWLDRSLSLQDVCMFGSMPVSINEGRDDAVDPSQLAFYKVGLALPNYSAPPRMKLNTLWVPTGATRWSLGLFLAGPEEWAKIKESVSSSHKGTLKLEEERWPDDANEKELSYEMYLLPPRLLNHPESGRSGYLLPLVDERYFWQFRDTGTLSISEGTSWDDVLNQLQRNLGASLSWTEIEEEYFSPDPIELSRPHENIALILDAVAACIGRRVVFDPEDESVNLQTPAEAKELLTSHDNDKDKTLAGWEMPDDVGNRIAKSVKVVFPKEVDGVTVDAVYTVTVDTEDGDMPSFNKKVFYDSAPAQFSGSASQPDNTTDLSDLANQIASDYNDWQERNYDVAYMGLLDAKITGFDNWLWYHFGYQHPTPLKDNEIEGDYQDDEFSSDYTCFTRVCSHPYNFGVSELLHGWPPETTTSTTSTSNTSSSASSSSASSSSSVSSSSSEGADVVVYVPTMFIGEIGTGDDCVEATFCIPKKTISIVNGALVAVDAGVDCIDICVPTDAEELSSSSATSSSATSSSATSSQQATSSSSATSSNSSSSSQTSSNSSSSSFTSSGTELPA